LIDQSSEFIATMELDSYTVVVLSDPDFRAHRDGNELIDDSSYAKWKKSHHECTFKASSNQTLDEQMRKVVPKQDTANTVAGCRTACE